MLFFEGFKLKINNQNWTIMHNHHEVFFLKKKLLKFNQEKKPIIEIFHVLTLFI